MGAYGGIIVGLSILLAGFSMAVLLPVAHEFAVSVRRTVQIRSRLSGDVQRSLKELLLMDVCTNGVLLCRIPARYLIKLPAFARLTDFLVAALCFRVAGCNRRAVAEAVLAFCAICGLAVFVLFGQVPVALVGAVMPLFFLQIKAQTSLRERKTRLREQLPDALRGLGMCFMAGLSLEQAFDQAARESQEPLRRELRHTVDMLRTGSSIQEALDALDTRLSLDEMRFVSVALEIQHRTGGSMREVLDAAADSLLASFELSRSLEVQTAQARMSARIVSVLPLVLVVVLSIAMEGYLATFFSSFAGLALLLCALGLEVAGIVIIRKILGINLE